MILHHLSGISCAGEIRISQHEDYEKWAIDILVKFRDSEKLQLLTAHRQSGGVRQSRFPHTHNLRARITRTRSLLSP